MDQIKKIFNTSKNIIATPAKEWISIKNGEEKHSAIFSQFALPYIILVTISSFVLLLKLTNATNAALGAAMYFIIYIVSIYLNAIIMNELLPFFDSNKNKDYSFKLIIYSSVPEWLAFIVVAILPFLGVLHIAAAVYSLYLLWKGIELFSLVTQEKRVQYTLTVIIASFIINFFVSYFSKSLTIYIVEALQF